MTSLVDPSLRHSRSWETAVVIGGAAGLVVAGLADWGMLHLLGWTSHHIGTIPQGMVAGLMQAGINPPTGLQHLAHMPSPAVVARVVRGTDFGGRLWLADVVAAVAGAAGGIGAAKLATDPPAPEKKHGRDLRPISAAAAALKAEGGGKRYGEAELFPGGWISADRATGGMLVMGGIGAGKSTLVKYLLRSLLADPTAKLLIRDVKGDFTAALAGRPDAGLLAPWDRRSLAWDIAADCRTRSDAQSFAAALIPDGGNDPVWSNGAREILVGILVGFQRARKNGWDFGGVGHVLGLDYPQLRAAALSGNPAVSLVLSPDLSRTDQSFLANLAAFMSPVFDLADAFGSAGHGGRATKISLRRWVAEDNYGPRILVLQANNALYPTLSKAMTRGALAAITAVIGPELPDNKNRKRWLILDEFPQVGKLPEVQTLLDTGRSKGLRTVLCIQDISQVREIYSTHVADSWSSYLGSMIFLRSGAAGATWASETIGDSEWDIPQRTTTAADRGSQTSHSYARRTVRTVPPEKFATLGADGRGITGIYMPTGPNIGEAVYSVRWPYTPDVDLAGEYPLVKPVIAAPWTAPGWPSTADKVSSARAREAEIQLAQKPAPPEDLAPKPPTLSADAPASSPPREAAAQQAAGQREQKGPIPATTADAAAPAAAMATQPTSAAQPTPENEADKILRDHLQEVVADHVLPGAGAALELGEVMADLSAPPGPAAVDPPPTQIPADEQQHKPARRNPFRRRRQEHEREQGAEP